MMPQYCGGCLANGLPSLCHCFQGLALGEQGNCRHDPIPAWLGAAVKAAAAVAQPTDRFPAARDAVAAMAKAEGFTLSVLHQCAYAQLACSRLSDSGSPSRL